LDWYVVDWAESGCGEACVYCEAPKGCVVTTTVREHHNKHLTFMRARIHCCEGQGECVGEGHGNKRSKKG
jgi:hypothetical protein